MLTMPLADNGRDEARATQGGHRRFKRAVGVAVGTVALGVFAVLLVGAYEDHLLSPAGGASARAPLPGDLFAQPRAPMPRVIVRYASPRLTPAAPAAAATTPAAPTPTGRHHPSPSPSPSGGDD